LNEYLPSISWIKVISNGKRGFYTFEWNGRLAALQEVFAKKDKIKIEVELYEVTKHKKILKYLEKLQKMNWIIK